MFEVFKRHNFSDISQMTLYEEFYRPASHKRLCALRGNKFLIKYVYSNRNTKYSPYIFQTYVKLI